jgi:hypothetical protein
LGQPILSTQHSRLAVGNKAKKKWRVGAGQHQVKEEMGMKEMDGGKAAAAAADGFF